MAFEKLFVIVWLLFGKSACIVGFKDLSAEDKFQNALEKQTFQSVLSSIADRLKNLDNIYSIQLSQTLESKLESYHRKIDSLDSKMIRLESLVMMNLDKISENINSKNYKDDVVKTNTFRKLDFLYEGLNHRMSYVDKKNDASHNKIQDKLDLLIIKLDKMEENMAQRSLDVEVELSEALQFTEDIQTVAVNLENLMNKTNQILNLTSHNSNAHQRSDENTINSDTNKDDGAISELNKKISKIEEKTEVTLNVTLTNENVLKDMKNTLADDFNSYANKVADMNSYFWKNNELTLHGLKSVEAILNYSRVEMKNSMRNLMVQIGKKGAKDSLFSDDSIDSVKKNLEEVLSSQKLFLESCYKVQSDEAQIESEISETLDKLIDLFQDKMKLATRDIRNLEKSIKNHDQRVARIVNQANSNVIHLFDKTVRGDEKIVNDLDDVKTNIQVILDLVQKLFNEEAENTFKKATLDQILNIITELNLRSYTFTTKNYTQGSFVKIKEEIDKETGKIIILLNNSIPAVNQLIKNATEKIEVLGNNITIYQSLVTNILQNLENHQKNIKDAKELNYTIITNELLTTTESIRDLNKTLKDNMESENPKTKNCTQQYADLIDLRADFCTETDTDNQENDKKNQELSTIKSNEESTTLKTTFTTESTKSEQLNIPKTNCSQDWSDLIDVRSDLCSEVQTITETSRDSNDVNESTTIIATTTSEEHSGKKNCTDNQNDFSDLIDIRGDLCSDINTVNSVDQSETATEKQGELTTERDGATTEISNRDITTKKSSVVVLKAAEESHEIKQALLDIFGPKPILKTDTDNNNSIEEVEATTKKETGEFQTKTDEENNNTTEGDMDI